MAPVKFYWHPEYRGKRDQWIFHKDIYEGDAQTLKRPEYLYLHEQEAKKDQQGNTTADAKELRRLREQRTSFLGIQHMIVDLWRTMFFRNPIEYDPAGKALIEADAKNIDGHGMTLDRFVSGPVLTNYLLYGDIWILVDAFGIQARSRGDEQKLGLRPFLECIEPLGVPDWDYEEDDPARVGKINSFRTQFEAISKRSGLTDAPALDVRTNVYVKTAGGYAIQKFKAVGSASEVAKKPIEEVQWETVSEGAGVISVGLSEIPVVRLSDEDWVHDLSIENRRHYNLRSSCDNIEYYQAYDKIIVIGDNIDGSIVQGMTEHSVAFFKTTNGQVIKIPANDATGIKQSIQDSLDACFKIGLNQVRALPSDSKATMAADSMLEEKDNTIAAVESSLTAIEDLMNDAFKFYAEFKGATPGKIVINKKINARDWNLFRSQLLAMRDILRKVEGFDAAAAVEGIKSLDFPEDTEKELIEAAKKVADEPIEPVDEEGGPIKKAFNGK